MTERLDWLGTTPLAALTTVALAALLFVLAVVVVVGMLGDIRTLWPYSWWLRRREASPAARLLRDTTEET